MIPKMRQFFKSKRGSGNGEEETKNRTNKLSAVNQVSTEDSNSSSGKGMDNKRNAIFAHIPQLNGHAYIDDDDEQPPPIRSSDTRPAPHWLDGPRDATVLPDIIASTYSDYSDEADYAMKQMLAILETLNPTEEMMELFESSLKAIEYRLPFDIILNEHKKPNWNAIRQKLLADSIRMTPSPAESSECDRPGMSTVQMSAVFDAIPFLFDAVACNHELEQYQNTLSMIVLIAMTGNSMIRRQSINAIQALMERSMLSQDFMCDGIVPGLFHIYQSGIGAFQSNDLRMECVQALCQVISYNTIHDRRWIFQNFVPRFSLMLKDSTMHVRKSALHIFGNLGNMFGQKFTEVFLVPHLLTLSCDMTWAVRKVACEIFVKVAECASNEVRVETLSPNFVRLLNDPNKWVSFIAYQQLGPFISLFANPDITGLDMKNGEVIVREIPPPPTLDQLELQEIAPRKSDPPPPEADDEFGVLPPNTWLPPADLIDDLEYQLVMNETSAVTSQIQKDATTTPTTTVAKTPPKRGERVMDSVLSGINKMFSPFERSSPKAKEVEKIAATFSSPSKRSPLSLHSAVSLMDKWSKRSNPNNPQRFPVFDSSANTNSTVTSSESSKDSTTTSSEQPIEGTGIAAKCNSTDDLTKLGLEDDDMDKPSNAFAMLATDGNDADRVADANDEDSDDEDDFDKSFVADEHDDDDDEDAPLMIDIKTRSESVSAQDLTEQKARAEPVSTEFSLTYWSSNYAISSILEDELKPFGSSSSFTNSPTSNSYLESRFDVMKISQGGGGASPRARSQSFGNHGSPIAMSPRRKANSTSEEPSSPPTTALLDVSRSDDSVVMLNTEEKEKLGILDIDEMNMSLSSNSSMNGEAGVTEDSDISLTSIEQAAFQHVPTDLVESYMRVMGPNGHATGSVATGDASLCAEIYRHCAHNFPAICYTLGRAAWPRLNLVFRKLAMDEQARVRQSISYSIHEIANMLGTEITDEDLLPVFYDLRNDQNADVRNGILTHLYDFVKCLSIEKRDEMILSLPQFFPIGAQPGNQAQNGDWRSRFELISQLAKLCSLYSIQDVNLHMSGIALTLADDRVAEVRREAVMLVSTIVGALVSAEWAELRQARDIENGHVDAKSNKKQGQTTFLSEQFVDDIVSSFAKTQKWTRRQTFCFICAQILRDKQCDGIQFRYFFSVPLQNLVQDKVPNVRLASCEAMSVWRKTLIAARSAGRGPSPNTSPPSADASTTTMTCSSESTLAAIRRDINLVSDMMVRLTNDSDIDAAFMAKKCQGLTDDHQPVDVEARTIRMREREHAKFGNIVITDPAGNLVKVQDGKIIDVIRRPDMPAPAPAAVTKPEKEAPLQSMDEFDEEILSHRESQALETTPPPEYQATVVQIAIASLEDNREEVDMEIDEEDEEQTEQEEAEPREESGRRKKTDEADVPMDPAPSAPESPKKSSSESSTSPSPTTTSSTSSSVVSIPIEVATSPEDSEA